MLDDFQQEPEQQLDEPVFLNDVSYVNQEEPRQLQETTRGSHDGVGPHSFHERFVLCVVLWTLMWLGFLRCLKKTVQSVRKLHKATVKDTADDG